jgi:hypothetical protein
VEVPEPKKIKSVDLVATPAGYYLDILPEDGPLERFMFRGVSQITVFSTDARRIALLSTGFEERTLAARDVREDDLVPSIGGGRVYSIDGESKHDDLSEDPVPTKHFTFAGTAAVLSIPEADGISVVRKI